MDRGQTLGAPGRDLLDLYRALFDIAQLLDSAEDRDTAAELLLKRIAEVAGADRGYIVVRDGDGFVEKFALHHGGDPSSERGFSRTLVETVVNSAKIHHGRYPRLDPRAKKSSQKMRLCSVLVAPLHHDGAVYGAIYLERPSADGFRDEIIAFFNEVSETAGLFLKRALSVTMGPRTAPDPGALHAQERDDLESIRSRRGDLFARYDFTGMVTRHPRMLEVLETAIQVADSGASILVRGETGTGKELLARAIHMNSPRKDRPLVIVHSTALPATVLESELFGHVRGAFTGADRDRAGRLASADGGTLLLDEIAEIPLELQAKLLRFVQFGEIQRLGSDRIEKVNVRILAATHQDLGAMVQAGKFRRDLYFRLRVVELTLPPLRERASDLPLLLDHYLRLCWRRPGPPPRFTEEAERALLHYSFPGNVRELAHLVERACLLARSSEIGIDLLPPELQRCPTIPPPAFARLTMDELDAARDAAVASVERTFLMKLMEQCSGNISLASRVSGIHRSYLQRLLTRYDIRGAPLTR